MPLLPTSLRTQVYAPRTLNKSHKNKTGINKQLKHPQTISWWSPDDVQHSLLFILVLVVLRQQQTRLNKVEQRNISEEASEYT